MSEQEANTETAEDTSVDASLEGGEETATDTADQNRKVAMDLTTAVDANGNSVVNEAGELISVPTNWSDEFKVLAKGAFADEVVYLRYKASLVDLSIASLTKTRDATLKKADKLEKIGNVEQRKNASKAQSLLEAAKKLIAKMNADGVDIDINDYLGDDDEDGEGDDD